MGGGSGPCFGGESSIRWNYRTVKWEAVASLGPNSVLQCSGGGRLATQSLAGGGQLFRGQRPAGGPAGRLAAQRVFGSGRGGNSAKPGAERGMVGGLATGR
jgi:hypothetical protein